MLQLSANTFWPVMLGCCAQSSSGEGIRDSHNELPSVFVVNVNYFFNPQSCKGLLKRLTIYFRTYIILQVTLKTAL